MINDKNAKKKQSSIFPTLVYFTVFHLLHACIHSIVLCLNTLFLSIFFILCMYQLHFYYLCLHVCACVCNAFCMSFLFTFKMHICYIFTSYACRHTRNCVRMRFSAFLLHFREKVYNNDELLHHVYM